MNSKSTFSNSTAKSFALALYELAQESKELDKVEAGIVGLEKLIKESIKFKEMILSPTVEKEDKKKVLFLIAEQNNFPKILKNFLGFLALKNRLFFIEKIIHSFLNLVSTNKGELQAKLVSSKKLSPEEQRKIKIELSKDFKSPLNIQFKYDADLVAGLIMQVGSVMIDTSIKNKLKKLEKEMIEAWYAD